MSIFVANENDIMGYVCYEHEEDNHLPSDHRRTVAQFWVKDQPCKKVCFTTKKSFYEHMKVFVGSDLAEYTDLHKAKSFMGHDFIQYYENNIMK
jgi:hypothetical protein